MTPIYLFLPALVAAAAFVLVFLFGLLVLLGRPSSRSLSTVGLTFALLGGMESVAIVWFAGSQSRYSDLLVVLGSLGVLGMFVSLIGAAIGRQPEAVIAGAELADRDRLGAILLCAGATLGLVGSAPTGFSFVSAILSLACFVLVLLFGVALFRKRPGDRFLAAVTVYFALVGGGADILFPPFGLVIHFGGALWLILVGPIGMAIAVAGAVIRIVPSSKR
jgi:hypothetical protein